MSDQFKEHLVKKEPTAMDRLTRAAAIAFPALLAAAGIVLYPPVLLVAIILGIISYFIIFPSTDIEYEYLLVNRSLDVDKVLSKQKRKKVKSFDLATAEIIAPLNSHRLDYYNGNSQIKTLDYSSGNPQHKRFAFVIRESGEAVKVIFEPDEDMARMMQQTMPGKCHLD
ncbi:MAG: hypothetical protein IKE58_01770 [Blautia sp.]|nr:hypothetical protein [Blautia sp.]